MSLNWSSEGDEADSEYSSSGRLSSCSLDSVIDYLDELLGRSGSVATRRRIQEQRASTEVAQHCSSKDEGFHQCAVPVPLDLDLSCASVYELPLRHQNQMGLVATEVAVDSGVDSCRSDDARSPTPPPPPPAKEENDEFSNTFSHDYQNIRSAGSSASRRNNRNLNKTRPSADSPETSASVGGGSKFYEICLGYLCTQLDAGSERCISIFSLQKHQDELIELGRPSGNSSNSAGSPSKNMSATAPINNHQQQQHHLQHRRTSEQGSPIVKQHHPFRQVSHDDPTVHGAKNNGNC